MEGNKDLAGKDPLAPEGAQSVCFVFTDLYSVAVSDSNCSRMDSDPRYLKHSADPSGGPRTGAWERHPPRGREQPFLLPAVVEASRPHPHLRHKHWERQFIARHHLDGHQAGLVGKGKEENSIGRFNS